MDDIKNSLLCDSVTPGGQYIAAGDQAKKTRVVSDHRHQTAIENGLQFTLWRTLIESFNMAAHRFADRQGKALAIALYVADQIPLIDNADHVAILPDQTGACSLNDGCGVFNQQKPLVTNRETTMDKAEAIEYLTANCA